MSRDVDEAKGTCREFLVCLSKGDWAGAHDLLAEEFSVWIPQLGETINEAETYITKLMESGNLGPFQIHNTYCESRLIQSRLRNACGKLVQDHHPA